jgi:hypothetical protein
VRSGHLSQGTFAANLAAVAYHHSEEPVYADAVSFFSATHLTGAMRMLLREAALVYSLQASVGEAVQEEGLLQTLEHITARIDARREAVSGDEV